MKVIPKYFPDWIVEGITPLDEDLQSTLFELLNIHTGNRTWMKFGRYFWYDMNNGPYGIRGFIDKYHRHLERITQQQKGPYIKKRPDWSQEGVSGGQTFITGAAYTTTGNSTSFNGAVAQPGFVSGSIVSVDQVGQTYAYTFEDGTVTKIDLDREVVITDPKVNTPWFAELEKEMLKGVSVDLGDF